MAKELHKNISVSSVTITTVTAKCERCKKVESGQCSYPNHASFVRRELKFSVIHVDNMPTGFPKEVLVCRDCLVVLKGAFEFGSK